MGALGRIDTAAQRAGLQVFGTLGAQPGDDVDGRAIILLGPDGGAFWPAFAASAEYQDSQPDPLDRWSSRVIGGIAAQMGAQAVFPFGGPPYRPFIDWALRSGRCWLSPVGLLVHDTAGLMVSYRGALVLDTPLDAHKPAESPCTTCAGQPCRTACPVSALTPAGYDIPACKAYVASAAGRDCLGMGCAVRRACPVSQRHGRPAEQSAFHMRAFAG